MTFSRKLFSLLAASALLVPASLFAADISFGPPLKPIAGASAPKPAATLPAPKPIPPTATSTRRDTSEVQALRTAYRTLAKADHDYQGHRIAAMRQIEAACDLLGSDIRGDGTGHEPQALSDAQLREARATVSQVRNAIPAGQQPRIATHLDNAVKQIDIALTIKRPETRPAAPAQTTPPAHVPSK